MDFNELIKLPTYLKQDVSTTWKCFVLCFRMNRSAKFILEKDLKEKSEAQHVDTSCSLMTTHTMKLKQPQITSTAPQR